MADHGVVCSMSRSDNGWDNAAMESFFSSLKTERIQRKTDEANSPVKPMDRWAEPLIMESMESLGRSSPGLFLSLYALLQSRQQFLNRSGLSSV
jgi:transposase InsO family protein